MGRGRDVLSIALGTFLINWLFGWRSESGIMDTAWVAFVFINKEFHKRVCSVLPSKPNVYWLACFRVIQLLFGMPLGLVTEVGIFQGRFVSSLNDYIARTDSGNVYVYCQDFCPLESHGRHFERYLSGPQVIRESGVLILSMCSCSCGWFRELRLDEYQVFSSTGIVED